MNGNVIPRLLVLLIFCASICAGEKQKQNLNTDDLAPVPKNEREAEYYKIVDLFPPPGTVVESGSFLSLPDGRLAIGTRRGFVLLADHASETAANRGEGTELLDHNCLLARLDESR